MRIKDLSRSRKEGFWFNTTAWLRSRTGLAQFLLAVGIGLLLALGASTLYRRGGQELVEPLIHALRVETEQTIETFLETNDLPNLYFDIGFEEYQTMAAQRQEALQRGILLLADDDWMSAQIRYQDQTIPVRIRLKGDWTDHLGESKWSFRVKIQNDAALMGMRSFSVQSPKTRAYLQEWLYLEDLRRADILGPRYSFVNVYVNGEDWGIYALEESFSKELLESQGRREGVIVRFEESLFWAYRAMYYAAGSLGQSYIEPFVGTLGSRGFALVDEFDTNRITEDPVLSKQREAALGLLRAYQSADLSPSEVFDAELMGRYLAHSNLWGAYHALAWHNPRYYYNPLTSRLEPIAYDNLPLGPNPSVTGLSHYDDLDVMEAYVDEVMRISQPTYLEELRAASTAEFERYRAVLLEEFAPHFLEPPWTELAERQSLLAEALHPPQTVYAFLNSGDTGSTTDIDIGNVLRFPVVLEQIKIGDRATAILPDWVSERDSRAIYGEAVPSVVLRSASGGLLKYITVHVPDTVIEAMLPDDAELSSNTVQIVTSLYGVDEQVVVDALWDYPPIATHTLLPTQPSVEEALAQHPFLAESAQPGFLALKPGEWSVAGDLVLPDGYGLWASEPVTLKFSQEAILFSTGPLVLQGDTPGSISLLPQDDHWAGLFVLQAGEERPSILYNVDIRATAGISRGGWITTGGITFYESPVAVRTSRLLDSIAEDTINVVRTEFEFQGIEFGNAASDAFDGDFVQGSVIQCAFHDVRGDAIDVSGSDISVESVSLLRVYDKGISAGEGSVVEARDVHASNIGMAIASKDMSRVNAQAVYIERAWVAGLAAYVKKMEYGPSALLISGVEFGDDSVQSMVQTGSEVTIDGKAARTTDLDVPDLYRRLEALGEMQVLDYRLGSTIRLMGYQLLTPDPGEEVRLLVHWQADATLQEDYTVFVHILNDSGEIASQKDTMPVDGGLPTSQWTVGPLIDDLHTIPLPQDLPAGEYRVVIGLYNWQTGDRLPVLLPSGEEIPDGAIMLEQVLTVSD